MEDQTVVGFEGVGKKICFVFNFIEEQHFQVSLSFQHYNYVIISSGHSRGEDAAPQAPRVGFHI